jgi:hypothetical protein
LTLAISLWILATICITVALQKMQVFPSEIERENAEAVGLGRTASIVLHPGAKNCQHKVFDNQTGRIADAATPCPSEVPVDDNGNPMPTGTVHTIDAISKSFR